MKHSHCEFYAVLCVYFYGRILFFWGGGGRDKNAALGLVNSIQMIFFLPHFKREEKVARERRSLGAVSSSLAFSDA